MKEEVHTIKFSPIVFVGLLALVMTPIVCSAQDLGRKGRGEVFILGQYMSGDTTTGLGAEIEIDDIISGGFGVGYNLNDNFNVNMDLFFSSTDITGKASGITVKGDTTIIGFDANLDVNILKGRFTPMITGGIGFMKFDGDIEDIIPFEETDFSYNVGGGFRWDIANHFFLKIIYRITWTKLEDADDTLMLDGITMSIGYRF